MNAEQMLDRIVAAADDVVVTKREYEHSAARLGSHGATWADVSARRLDYDEATAALASWTMAARAHRLFHCHLSTECPICQAERHDHTSGAPCPVCAVPPLPSRTANGAGQ
jgi:hypothetical protein